MMRKGLPTRALPSVKALSTRILKASVRQNSVRGALTFLESRHAVISEKESVEELAFALRDDAADPRLSGIEFNFMLVRSVIARELWSRHFFVGASVLDRLLFGALRTKAINPVGELLARLLAADLHSPGFVVYPIHSFGLASAGIPGLLESVGIPAQERLTVEPYGMALLPQANDLSAALEAIRRAAAAIGVSRRFDADDFRHFIVTRGTKWVTRNPLLLLKVQSVPGDYYENQPFLLGRLRFATSLLFMMATLEPALRGKQKLKFGSSSQVNNAQTLDLRHYVVLSPDPVNKDLLRADCVPMRGGQWPELIALSDLPVELDASLWLGRRVVARAAAALMRVEATVLNDSFSESGAGSVLRRVCQKLADSLTYFRRSIQREAHPEEAIVNLMIGFEVMLTDDYSSGVGPRIQRRLDLACAGFSQRQVASAGTQGLAALYKARSEIVHDGKTTQEVDLPSARVAFVRAFIGIVERLDDLPPVSSHPLGDLLGDVVVSDRHGCPECGYEHRRKR